MQGGGGGGVENKALSVKNDHVCIKMMVEHPWASSYSNSVSCCGLLISEFKFGI